MNREESNGDLTLFLFLELIEQLGEGKIGTGNSELLEQYILPTGRPQFNIVITWPIEKKPQKELPVYSYVETGDVSSETQVVSVLTVD